MVKRVICLKDPLEYLVVAAISNGANNFQNLKNILKMFSVSSLSKTLFHLNSLNLIQISKQTKSLSLNAYTNKAYSLIKLGLEIENDNDFKNGLEIANFLISHFNIEDKDLKKIMFLLKLKVVEINE